MHAAGSSLIYITAINRKKVYNMCSRVDERFMNLQCLGVGHAYAGSQSYKACMTYSDDDDVVHVG